MRGLSWDRLKVRAVALLTLAVMALPGGTALAATETAPEKLAPVSQDIGTVTYSGQQNAPARGVSWS